MCITRVCVRARIIRAWTYVCVYVKNQLSSLHMSNLYERIDSCVRVIFVRVYDLTTLRVLSDEYPTPFTHPQLLSHSFIRVTRWGETADTYILQH